MKLSKEQQAAMDKIMSWCCTETDYENNWMFYLGGYAGTGKTTLIQEIINRLDKPPVCLAPTGKAASVLQKKLESVKVTTIHRAMYKPVMPDTTELERLEFELISNPKSAKLLEAIKEVKKKLAAEELRFVDNLAKGIQPRQLVVVDEASMVTPKMAEDLKQTGAWILFVGDPGQLPPVKDFSFIFNETPDAMLSQIQRQALDNPIIALSMTIREGNMVDREIENEHILRRPKSGYLISDLTKADQVLTGKNATRRSLNRRMRKLLGFEGDYPRRGEKLICLKNKYDTEEWLINGVSCLAASDLQCNDLGDLIMDIMYEDHLLHRMRCYAYPFESHYHPEAIEDPWASRGKLAEFDFGYAITVHKSQGSEWDRVVLLDDDFNFGNRRQRRRWLYTAVTRARNHLTWLTNA